MLLPTPRKPLPPNPQGSVRPRRRPGAEEKTAKDSGLKRTHSTALGEESKSAASQKELKKRTNKRGGKKKKRVLQVVPLPNFLRGRVGEIARLLPSSPARPLPPPLSLACSGPRQPPETSLTLGAWRVLWPRAASASPAPKGPRAGAGVPRRRTEPASAQRDARGTATVRTRDSDRGK